MVASYPKSSRGTVATGESATSDDHAQVWEVGGPIEASALAYEGEAALLAVGGKDRELQVGLTVAETRE